MNDITDISDTDFEGQVQVDLIRDGKTSTLVLPESEWERLRKSDLTADVTVTVTGTDGEHFMIRLSDIFFVAHLPPSAQRAMIQRQREAQRRQKTREELTKGVRGPVDPDQMH